MMRNPRALVPALVALLLLGGGIAGLVVARSERAVLEQQPPAATPYGGSAETSRGALSQEAPRGQDVKQRVGAVAEVAARATALGAAGTEGDFRAELQALADEWNDIEFQRVDCLDAPCLGLLAGPDPSSPMGNDAYERALARLRLEPGLVYGSQQRGVGQTSVLIYARTERPLDDAEVGELYERMRESAAALRAEMGEQP